jgi:hypothetical protein
VTPVISAALILLSCLGAGAVVLRLLGILATIHPRERIAWSFALGLGLVGWLFGFYAYAGWLSHEAQAVSLAIIATGSFLLLMQPAGQIDEARFGAAGKLLLILLLGLMTLGVIEALAPPSDGDSLAYHFALPKQFLAAGHLQFVPRAVDGAVPLLLQMTYLPAFALGDERGLTFWCLFSGWMTVHFVYVLCRRYANPVWSLAVALLFMTTPAVIYGAGSGHIEVRLAAFVLLAAFAVAEAMRSGNTRFALVAGLAAGFFAGGKYTGLLFVAAAGLTILIQRRWFMHGLAFGVGVLLACFQWYLWNWINTGDPVFPMLFDWLGAKNGYWDAAQAAKLKTGFFDDERALPLDPLGFLFYPFAASFGLSEKFESLRTGFGPFVLLALPFVLLGIWQGRSRLRASELLPVASILILFYGLWYFTGSSQRVRHLLPLYPLLLVAVTAASLEFAKGAAKGALVAATALTLFLQSGGAGLFSLNALQRLIADESRQAYLTRQIGGAEMAFWANGNLPRGSKVAHGTRELNYLFDLPYYYVHKLYQTDLSNLFENSPQEAWADLQKQGITHVVALGPSENAAISDWPAGKAFVASGCAEPIHSIKYNTVSSRTLVGYNSAPATATLLKLAPDCRF